MFRPRCAVNASEKVMIRGFLFFIFLKHTLSIILLLDCSSSLRFIINQNKCGKFTTSSDRENGKGVELAIFLKGKGCYWKTIEVILIRHLKIFEKCTESQDLTWDSLY